MSAEYIELHTASAFSFLQGASLPEALVDRAAELGYSAIALLDRDGVYGAPRFHKAATTAGIKPIIGAELTIQPFPPVQPLPPFTLPVLCESQEGYRNLCRLITRMKMRAPKGGGALALEELEGFTTGLVALAGRAALDGRRYGVGGLMDRLVGLFGRDRVYVELQRHFRRDEEAENQALVELAAAFRVPPLATNGVRFATPSERPLFDVLTCICHHTDLAQAGRRLAPNGERYLKPPSDMAALFADCPDAVARARDLADRLHYTMADLGYRFPAYPVPPGETEPSFLRRITEVGARERYRPCHERARVQVARELDLIEKLNLAGYFLIVWDIVNFCRQHDILVQGRGSAANSAVCYSLGITAVDPVGMDLLFERFLSEERGEWPDIDLDLPSGDRRERVIQHVYEKYGRLGAAMTANVITYRGRSAAREVGKVLGFDPVQVDRLAKAMNSFEFVDQADTLPRHLASVGLDMNSDRVRLFARLWGEMQDLPRHLGQHSGGMVICQGQLDACVPLENASMPGRVVVQWDKDDCADMGIVKVDLLGLGMMAVLQDAITLVNQGRLGAPAAGASIASEASGAAPASGGGAPRAQEMMAVLQDAIARVNSPEPLRSADALSNSAGGGAPARLEKRQNTTINAETSACGPSERESASESSWGWGPTSVRNEHAEISFEKPISAGSASSAFHRRVLDLAHLPEDPAVYKMLTEADTIGVFQVESRAQMATLPRLKPACFYDIVVQVAIIRPGPIVGQMVHPYLNRRAGREPVRYPHPSLEPILARTLGVPLFQEQLLRMAMVAAGFTGGQAEDLRRAFGFKRSERRMKQIEVQLRDGMTRQGIPGEAAEQIITSITSFALYGFPESHAASFALLAYASAYLKVHYPAAFYTALLNNQPMGFYHPSTLVKDAQRRGVRFHSIDVQVSDWDCRVETDGAIRLGLRYVTGLREQIGRAIASRQSSGAQDLSPALCPKCGCDDRSMLEVIDGRLFCNVCSYSGPVPTRGRESTLEAEEQRSRASAWGWGPTRSKKRFASMDDLLARTGLRRDEIVTLADIGALNSFGYDRRSALWQAERAVRPSGALFTAEGSACGPSERESASESSWGWGPTSVRNDLAESVDQEISADSALNGAAECCPLKPMNEAERLVADYAGMGLTVGRHPMALRREELAMRGVWRAADLATGRPGRRVRVAGMVITRQRPGTAKGFVFLTLEDETGVANIIVRPDLFARDRLTIVEEPFLIVDGVLQNQDGVISIRAEAIRGLRGVDVDVDAHDFY